MMENKSYHIEYKLYKSFNDLPEHLQKLYSKSKEACKSAYAPYSNFNVGAALLLESGETILGSNQENAAYPSGLCAERTVLFYFGANYKGQKIKSIAVAATKDNSNFIENISPCGGCRQVLAEYENIQNEKIEFLMPGLNGEFIVHHSVKNFLPFEFDKVVLGS